MPFWNELTHGQFLSEGKNTKIAVLVTGSLEAHGRHLPLGTDSLLPEYLAKHIAENTNALVLPTIPLGDSWIFNQFEGTISVRPKTLIDFYTDIMKGVFIHGFKYIIALNGHGGNAPHLESAARLATKKGEHVVIIVNWWRDLAKEVKNEILETPAGHAGEDETSEMLFIRPNLVDMPSAHPARVRTKYRVVSAWYREELYPKATYGDPTKATSEKGKTIMEHAKQEIIKLIEELEMGKLPFKGSNSD
jgi:creatinine amidohydrolase